MQVVCSIVVCLHGSTPILDFPQNQPRFNMVKKGLPAPCVRKLLVSQEHTHTLNAEARRRMSFYMNWQQYSRSLVLVCVGCAATSASLTSTKSILPSIARCVQGRLVLRFAALVRVRSARDFFVSCLHLCVCGLPRKAQHHTINHSKRFQKRGEHPFGSFYATDHLDYNYMLATL